jgi:hypothetical protein
MGREWLPSDLVAYRIRYGSEVRPISTHTDNPSTFYDINGNSVFDGTDIVLDESQFSTTFTTISPFQSRTIIVDGIEIEVVRLIGAFRRLICTANGTGPVFPPDAAALAFNGSGFPTTEINGLNNDRPRIFNNGTAGLWGIHAGSDTTGQFTYSWFLNRLIANDKNVLQEYDFEIRFTASGGMAMWLLDSLLHLVPFELWNTGRNTPDDTFDDYRMIPVIDDRNGNTTFDLVPIDHPISGGDNDPQTDMFYWVDPVTKTAGDAGYQQFASGGAGIDKTIMSKMTLVNWNGGSVSDTTYPANVNQLLPATGTVYRLETVKSFTPSDRFTFTIIGNDTITSRKALKNALDTIRVVPNPFYLTAYQQGLSFNKEVKFIHLPGNCTIRIFTVSGDLVRILQHNSTSNNNRPGFGPYSDESAAPLETSLESWDLRNDRGKLVASGIYIAAIEAPGIGRQLVKFAVMQ